MRRSTRALTALLALTLASTWTPASGAPTSAPTPAPASVQGEPNSSTPVSSTPVSGTPVAAARAAISPAKIGFIVGRDVYRVKVDGTGLTRLTATRGSREAYEHHLTSSGNAMAWQVRVGAYRYQVIVARGAKASAPLQRFTRASIPARRRWHSFGSPQLSRDGRTMLVTCQRSLHGPHFRSQPIGLCIYNFKKKALKVVKANCGCKDFGMPPDLAWSANRRYVAYAAANKVKRIDLKTGKTRLVYKDPAGGTPTNPTITANGNKVAWADESYGPGGYKGIAIRTISTGAVTRVYPPVLTTHEYAYLQWGAPSFSADGTRLAVLLTWDDGGDEANDPEQPPGLYVIDLAGNIVRGPLVVADGADISLVSGFADTAWAN
ncbi:hypothetical protein [Nocardioides sp. J54]|uniref:hypothetical protein n=1 Tax=Nocardioides sp. J54 TaxID=935866 RepID=UPI000491E5C2|nr:hypothetical protein [Nocardioides sp. J54]